MDTELLEKKPSIHEVMALCDVVRDIKFEAAKEHIDLCQRLYELAVYHRSVGVKLQRPEAS